jgi:ParB-like chromosome segregation protein Spo0J
MDSYQYLPSLSLDEYEALRESIRKYGVIQPVIVDETGTIIDGYHRVKVCHELGIEYPTRVMKGLSEEEKENLSVSLNIKRRHLTKDQKKELALALREQDWTQERIASVFEVTQKTISNWLAIRNFSSPDQPLPKPDKPDESSELRKKVEYYEDWAKKQEKERQAQIDAKVKSRTEAMKAEYERQFAEAKAKLKSETPKVDSAEINRMVEELAAEKLEALEKARREAEAERVNYDREHQKRLKELEYAFEGREKSLKRLHDEKMKEIDEASKAGLDVKKLKSECQNLANERNRLESEIEEERNNSKIRGRLKKAESALVPAASMMELAEKTISSSLDCCGLSIEEMEAYIESMERVEKYAHASIAAFRNQIEKIRKGGGLRVI